MVTTGDHVVFHVTSNVISNLDHVQKDQYNFDVRRFCPSHIFLDTSICITSDDIAKEMF